MSQTDKKEQINKMSQTDSQDNKQVETMISMVKFEQKPVATWSLTEEEEEMEEEIEAAMMEWWTDNVCC